MTVEGLAAFADRLQAFLADARTDPAVWTAPVETVELVKRSDGMELTAIIIAHGHRQHVSLGKL